jgi:hypothetical protein
LMGTTGSGEGQPALLTIRISQTSLFERRREA